MYYQRIDINGDPERLPKTDEPIYVHVKSFTELRRVYTDGASYRQLKKRIDWYLIPCTDKRDELIEKLKELIKFYGEELDKYGTFSLTHPWMQASGEAVAKGAKLRAEIAELENKFKG